MIDSAEYSIKLQVTFDDTKPLNERFFCIATTSMPDGVAAPIVHGEYGRRLKLAVDKAVSKSMARYCFRNGMEIGRRERQARLEAGEAPRQSAEVFGDG